MGYDKVNVTAAKTLSSLYNELHTTAKWYPGEGEPVIDFLVSVTSYLQKSYDLADLDQTSDSFDNILSMLLENDSVVNEKVSVFQLSDVCGSIGRFYNIIIMLLRVCDAILHCTVTV